MNKEIIAREMQNLIEVIREQQEIVLSHKEAIPQIELEILMGNVRKLYERLWELRGAVGSQAVGGRAVGSQENQLTASERSHSVPVSASVSAEPASDRSHSVSAPASVSEPVSDRSHSASASVSVNEPVSPSVPAPVPARQPEELLAAIETPVQAPVEEITNEAILPQASLSQERVKEFTKPAAKPSAAATLFDEPATVADKFVGAPSLYDKIASSTQDKSIATRLQRNPVTDLKKSIGINEKFSFINDLFDGDLAAYTDAIEKLNSGPGLQEALSFLETGLAAKYNWDGESETYRKLKDLVERRFMA